jgi:hypothetical protein
MACLAANSSRLPPRQTGPHVLNSHDQGRHGPEIKKKKQKEKREKLFWVCKYSCMVMPFLLQHVDKVEKDSCEV